jgi:hypothetical protein
MRFAVVQEGLTDGEHTLHLKVLNTNSTGTDGHYFEVINVCKAGNWLTAAPIANAGDDIKILTGTAVNLNGLASFDPDDEAISSYDWSIVTAPEGSTATILAPSESITEITPDIEGKYRIGLVVNDGIYNSIRDIKIINAKLTNNAPVANAGVDRNIPTRVWCYPNGSASSDADGDSLSFAWRKVSEPSGSNARLFNTDTRTLKFMPSAEGEYTMGLIVNDSLESSEEDLLVLTAIDGYSGLQEMSTTGLTLISYPNPAERQINIQYTVPFAENLCLSIVSLDGKKKVELLNALMQPGDYSLVLDISNLQLNAGIYLLQMISDQGRVYNKITIF